LLTAAFLYVVDVVTVYAVAMQESLQWAASFTTNPNTGGGSTIDAHVASFNLKRFGYFNEF
jgi:hypothetical protein